MKSTKSTTPSSRSSAPGGAPGGAPAGRLRRGRFAAPALALALLACGPPPAAEVGAALFVDPRVSASEFNSFSCATCHTVGAAVDPQGPLMAGADLGDVVFRPRWWGGAAPTLLDAVNHCLVFFMREPAWRASDPRGRALYEYLLQHSPKRPAAAQPLTLVENVTTVPRGDPARGEGVWQRACQSCHGDIHTGAGRISDLASVVPESSLVFAEESGFSVDLVIVEKVRHGPFFGVGGNMPPFATEQLSDEDLGALLGYLLL